MRMALISRIGAQQKGSKPLKGEADSKKEEEEAKLKLWPVPKSRSFNHRSNLGSRHQVQVEIQKGFLNKISRCEMG